MASYSTWEESPLGKWKREDVDAIDYRSAEGKRLKKETNLSTKEVKEILNKFKNNKTKVLRKVLKKNDEKNRENGDGDNGDGDNGDGENGDGDNGDGDNGDGDNGDGDNGKKNKKNKKYKKYKKYKNNKKNKKNEENYEKRLELLERIKNNEKVHAFFVSSIIRILCKQKGPGYFNRMKSSNPEDFHSFELIKNIHRKDFHSFYENKIIFSFHTNSLMELVKCENKKKNPATNQSANQVNQATKQSNQVKMMEIPKNPYTGKRIPKYTFKYICRKIEMEFTVSENKISEDQKVKIKLERLFQHIDSFGYITNLNWFLDMNLHALRQWYRLGEDLWNYRAQLTDIQKRDIAPMDAPFTISLNEVYRIHTRRTLQKIVLNQIENLIMYGENSTTQSLGCIYVLMIFTQTNSNIAEALPGIAQ